MRIWRFLPQFSLALVIALPATAEVRLNSEMSLADPLNARDAATLGDAFIADSTPGPLGLRFSGGVVIDSQAKFANSEQETGIDDLRDGSPYLGIGVVQTLGREQRIDLSADLGMIQRMDDTDCAAGETCKTSRNNEAVLSVGIQYRF